MASVPVSAFDIARLPTESNVSRKTKVLVVSSVALSFISFWRAAAIVLCDLASTAYYIGGISEQAVGKAAPWFILAVMLFSYAVRAVYVESCTMFTRGGVYKVVKEAMGGSLAKLSVSALMFDYVLTGPISGVSAGQYLIGLVAQLYMRIVYHADFDAEAHKTTINMMSAGIAILITLYFWRTNILGIGESSDKAMKIMKLTTVMGILIILWCGITMLAHPVTRHLPPVTPVLTSESSGWLANWPKILGAIGVVIAFGHSLLAMSGEESLAQVNREIEAPKLKNLLRAGFVIFLYSMLLTSLISFFAVMIIPDQDRIASSFVDKTDAAHKVDVDYFDNRTIDGKSQIVGIVHRDGVEQVIPQPANSEVVRSSGKYTDNLISGLAMNVIGPVWAKLCLQTFVVFVGFMILAGAVNTSIVGANGVLNRLAEDGVLTPSFLHPHPRFGTTHRLINMIAILQILVIVASMGEVYALGEAYAFGVVWSFVFKTLAMVVLRFKDKSHRDYEVPGNIRVKKGTPQQIDLPLGITAIFLILLSVAAVNLFTKKVATVWGIGFTIVFLVGFIICERISHARRKGEHHAHLEQFNQTGIDSLTPESVGLDHASPILVAARGPRSLPMLEKVLHETDTDTQDVVVLTCKVIPKTDSVADHEQKLDNSDRDLLTKVVTVAEEIGKEVKPVVLPTNDPLYAIARAAIDLKAHRVVMGVSEKMHADMQLEQFAIAWGIASGPGRTAAIKVRIIGPQIDLDYDLE